jgi:hypothetical protein
MCIDLASKLPLIKENEKLEFGKVEINMNLFHRIALMIVAVCIGISLLNQFIGDYWKSYLHDKVKFSIAYYKLETKNYYNHLMGITPPPLVIKHPEEWKQFGILCDSLLLDSSTSVHLFSIYIDCLDEVKADQKPFVPMHGRNRMDGMRLHQTTIETALKLFKIKAEPYLEHNELQDVDIVFTQMFAVPDVELRALRMIDLHPEQRVELLPLSTQLVQTIPAPRPDFLHQDESMYEQVKEDFLTKLDQILTENQKEIWKVKCIEIRNQIKETFKYRRPFPMQT